MIEEHFAICILKRLPDSDDRVELLPLATLSAAEHDDLATRYQRMRLANHPPMLEMLKDAHEDLRTRFEVATSTANATVNGPGIFPQSLNKHFDISLFAAISAVYAYQEHAQAVAKRMGGNEYWMDHVNPVFSRVYSDNWKYLLAYKLRRAFTHQAFDAAGFRTSSWAEEGEVRGGASLHYELVRENLPSQIVGATLMGKIRDLPHELEVLDLLAAAEEGVARVEREIRPMLYPEQADDVEALGRWAHHLLGPLTPTCLFSTPNGELSLMTVEPRELIAGGVVPPSSPSHE